MAETPAGVLTPRLARARYRRIVPTEWNFNSLQVVQPRARAGCSAGRKNDNARVVRTRALP